MVCPQFRTDCSSNGVNAHPLVAFQRVCRVFSEATPLGMGTRVVAIRQKTEEVDTHTYSFIRGIYGYIAYQHSSKGSLGRSSVGRRSAVPPSRSKGQVVKQVTPDSSYSTLPSPAHDFSCALKSIIRFFSHFWLLLLNTASRPPKLTGLSAA